MVPRIRAALDAKVPPRAILLGDPAIKEYNSWDLKIVTAYRIHEDFMRGSVPVYWDESDRVAFDVKVGISKSRRALDRREEADNKKEGLDTKGRYYYVEPRTIDGGPMPTYEEWLEERARKQGK